MGFAPLRFAIMNVEEFGTFKLAAADLSAYPVF